MSITAATLFGEEPAARPAAQPGVLSDDWRAEKAYYTIGEVAALFGAPVSQIRFWTNEFALKVRTTSKGDRLYNGVAIARLRAIHRLLRDRGFTIAGAKAELKRGGASTVSADGPSLSPTSKKKKGTPIASGAAGKAANDTEVLRQRLLALRNTLMDLRNRLS